MAEIAVTMLDVDEGKASAIRQLGGRNEILHEPRNVVVAQNGVEWLQFKPAIENGVMVKNLWFAAVFMIGIAKAPGVRQLQSHQQISAIAMLVFVRNDQGFAQVCQIAQILFVDQE